MKYIICAVACLYAGTVNATVIEFIPPNDPTGSVFTTNTNDGWNDGRGLVFQMTSNETVSSVGLFHDLTNINLSYELAQVASASGTVTTGQTVLASGNSPVNTRGLEWIDFAISDLLLTAGNFYHLEFTFSGNGNQNFFYSNANVDFSQGSFTLIDGTHRGSTSNTVMPALRFNAVSNVPEPASIALLGLGLAGFVFSRKRKLLGQQQG